jgi:hypothetical protein
MFYYTGQLEPAIGIPCEVCAMSMIKQDPGSTVSSHVTNCESHPPARPKGVSSRRTKWEKLESSIVPYKFRIRKPSHKPGLDPYKKRI